MTVRRRSVRKVARIPKSKRTDVTREEFNAVVDLLNERGEIINEIRIALEVQFKRIAQMQAELDQIRRALDRRGSLV